MIEKYYIGVAIMAEAHAGQVRKGSDVPYISHPLAVGADVMARGGNMSQVLGGLLHDTAEDCGRQYLDRIKNEIGADVYQIVLDCSDCIKNEGPKLGWYIRKLEYLLNFQNKTIDSYLVILCDKLHNSRATIQDFQTQGFDCLTKFRAPPEMVVWYFVALTCLLRTVANSGKFTVGNVDDLKQNTLELISFLSYRPTQSHIDIRETNALRDMLETLDPFVCNIPQTT